MSTLAFPAMPLRPSLVTPEVVPSMALIPGTLHIALTVDEGSGPRRVDAGDLIAWNTTIDELLPMAINRMNRESSKNSWRSVDTIPGILLLRTGDGNASARMLNIQTLMEYWPTGGVVIIVPSADQLMAVPLTSVADLNALNVMVTAAHYAYGSAEEPLSDQAFWTDGTRWHQINVTHTEEDTHMDAPVQLLNTINHLAAIDMVSVPAEA